ncbi:hypothetical protein AB1Y20_002896 [Prymnesium parvum]|uniref:Cyclic nucleotide-binding domain-containing protein n=1 Tax=Prymnesium parvum TaxID=97485 RepID=A0AB34JC22_PRYPA
MHKGHDSPLPALTQLLPWLNVTDPRPSSAVGRSRSDLPDDRLHHAPHAPHAPHERSRSHGPPSTSRQPSSTDATRPPPKGRSLSARGHEAIASPRTPRFKLQHAPSHEGEQPPAECAAPLDAPRALPRRKGREPRLIRDSTNDWMLDHRLPGVMVCERAMPADPPSHEELRAPRAVSFGETAEDEAAAAQAIADQALERHRRRRLSRMPVTPIDPEQVAEEHLCERYAEERMSEPTALRAWLRDKVDAAPGSQCTEETGWNHYINGVESDSAHLHALTQQRKRLSTMPGTDPRLRHALKTSGSHRASAAQDGGGVERPLLPRPMSEYLGVLGEDKRALTCRHFKSPLATCNEETSPLESPVVKQGGLLTARKRRSTRHNPSSCRRSSCSESEEGAEEAEDDVTDGEPGSPCTPRSSLANKQKRMEPQFFFSKVRLLQVVAAVPWLANEPTIKLVRLCRRAQHKVVSRYTAICREGGAGSHFYVLLEGSARMSSSLLKLDYELSKGECFGESVLMGDRCRRATVVALTQCSLLQFFMEDVERAQIDLTELSIRYRIQLLSSNSIFASFPEEKILRPLAMMTGVRDFQACA